MTVASDTKLPPGMMLTVSLTYQEASAPNPAKRTRWDGNGLTYGEPKTVTKEVVTVPCTFEINVGGNTPPKMVAFERAVRATGGR